jgi:hypothetical protein
MTSFLLGTLVFLESTVHIPRKKKTWQHLIASQLKGLSAWLTQKGDVWVLLFYVWCARLNFHETKRCYRRPPEYCKGALSHRRRIIYLPRKKDVAARIPKGYISIGATDLSFSKTCAKRKWRVLTGSEVFVVAQYFTSLLFFFDKHLPFDVSRADACRMHGLKETPSFSFRNEKL